MVRYISIATAPDERGSGSGAIGRTPRDWWRRRQARRAPLHGLSDHQLRDIGLRRKEPAGTSNP
jgi:uncharacterized protein YjiS (DUF1127 family)